MKLLLVHIILLTGALNNNEPVFKTHFIGMQKSELTAVIREKHVAFKLNTSAVNKSYNYLKFEDSRNEITALFFIDKHDKCKAVRIMSDYSNINDIIFQLDANYTKVDDANWKYLQGKKEFSVTLEEGDWFFTVSIKEKD